MRVLNAEDVISGENYTYRGYTVKFIDGPYSDTAVYSPDGQYLGLQYNATEWIDKHIKDNGVNA